jgi:hypothetical protein
MSLSSRLATSSVDPGALDTTDEQVLGQWNCDVVVRRAGVGDSHQPGEDGDQVTRVGVVFCFPSSQGVLV